LAFKVAAKWAARQHVVRISEGQSLDERVLLSSPVARPIPERDVV
jgi:hypothetical protein